MIRRQAFWLLGFSSVLVLAVASFSQGSADSTKSAASESANKVNNDTARRDSGPKDSGKDAGSKTKDNDVKKKDLTFDDIKFEMKKGDPFKRAMLTEKIEKLDGKSVRLRGYILPSFQQSGITQFVLVRDNLECCFGPGAALYDCILVEMEMGKSTSYTVRPIAVEGIFTINEFKGPDGKHLAIYHLKGQHVK